MRYSVNEMSLARGRTVIPKIKSSLLNDYIEFCLKNKDYKTAVLAFGKRNGREFYFVDNRFVEEFIIERGFCLSLENNIERVLKHLRAVEKDSIKLRDSVDDNRIKSFFNNSSSRISSLFNKLNDSCVELSQVIDDLNSDILDFNDSQNYANELRDVVGCYLCDFVDGEIIKTDKESDGYSINNFYLKDILENICIYINNRIRLIASADNVSVNRFFISISKDNLLNINFYSRIGVFFKIIDGTRFSDDFEQVESLFSDIGFETIETEGEYRVVKRLELLSQKDIDLSYEVVIKGSARSLSRGNDMIVCYIYLLCNE